MSYLLIISCYTEEGELQYQLTLEVPFSNLDSAVEMIKGMMSDMGLFFLREERGKKDWRGYFVNNDFFVAAVFPL